MCRVPPVPRRDMIIVSILAVAMLTWLVIVLAAIYDR
jgi:hypothetical protein